MGNRAGQNHSVWYEVVGGSDFVLITNVSVAAANGSLRVALSQSQGNIASGVKVIRVVVNQSYFVYREMDVVGAPTAAPPPTLQVAWLNSRSIKVWWTAPAIGYRLEATPTLGPAAAWQIVTNASELTNGNYQIILPAANTQFLRMEK
jgi:hypothetical protein